MAQTAKGKKKNLWEERGESLSSKMKPGKQKIGDSNSKK
jgi:hypothetical protein